MFADIIIDITHEKLDKVFQYRIPPELEGVLQVGMEVVVPFGKGNKETHGYVIGFSEKEDYELSKRKFFVLKKTIRKSSQNWLLLLHGLENTMVEL